MDAVTELLSALAQGILGELTAIVLAVLAFLFYHFYKYAKENWSWFASFIEWSGVLENEKEVKDWAFRMAEEAFDDYVRELQEKGQDIDVEKYIEKAAEQTIGKYAPKAFEFAGLEKDHVKSFIRQRWRDLRDSS